MYFRAFFLLSCLGFTALLTAATAVEKPDIDLPLQVAAAPPAVTPAPPVVPKVTPKPEPIYDPSSSVFYSVGDIQLIPDTHRPYMRYLSLYNVPKALRRNYASIVSFVINSLGKHKKMFLPDFVGLSDETVLRINLKYYEISPEAWDRLGKNGSGVRAFPEPYFHSFVEELVPKISENRVKKTRKVPTGQKYNDGTPETKDEEYEVIEKVKVAGESSVIKLVPAIWLNAETIGTLCKETHSEFPIFRADWFIVNAITPPAYYDLLGVGNKLEDFEALVFGDFEKTERSRSQDKGIVLKSVVARNVRTLTRSPSLRASHSYYWRSHDSLKSVGKRDYVKRILDEEFDATEDIATLPNGLQAYFLTDGKGKRLDAADPNIAIDNTAIDRTVRTGRSCMICHSDGIRPIEDEIRSITEFRNVEQVKLLAIDEERYLRVQDLFGSDLNELVASDQLWYAKAVARATGFDTPAKNATILATIYDGYAEDFLTKENVALDCGITVDQLEKYVRGVDVGEGKRISSNDNVVLGLIKKPIRPVRRDQWEQSYQGFMALIMQMKNLEKATK